MRFRVVIPARFGSTRLPGKPLLDIAGAPMIRHVWQRATASGAQEVLIATDDERVLSACEGFGATAIMTSSAHASGTDRIAEVAALAEWGEDELVVNVQGDEPLIPSENIRQVADLLHHRPDAEMATLCTGIRSLDEYLDTNVVKVVRAEDGGALYFSRAPIPWHRDTAPSGIASQSRYRDSLRHIGIYAYRVGALMRLSDSPQCPLEVAEALEQLRALWLGYSILADVAVEEPGPGVDTPEGLEHVRSLMAH
ncbi:MAG: 3-deoxy-manno-octulosonate cytidylyltransferase [Gammaproteobacteria bacterium]|nr:MAG: 3-deoxy-manno-octulosonate cytidylyltransferase [Gammaproteobacteria bacterium]